MASREQLLDTPERWSRLDVSIPGDPTILDLDVSVSGYHTEIGAVRLRVEHPKGSSAQIIEYWTCAEDGFDIAGAAGGSIVVDDEAGQPLSAGCTAPDFDPGRYQANGAWLSSFDGLGANGQWTLWTQASFWPGYQGGNVLWDPQVFEWCLTVTY